MFDSLKIDFYGGSHEEIMGAVIYGLKKDTMFSMDKILALLKRRSPSKDTETTRMENDIPEFLSGVKNDGGNIVITEDKVEFIIRNKDYRDSDYNNIIDVPRPSHADYAAYMKYGRIPVGGGKYSGRMTALMCVIGSIAMQVLEKEGIHIKSSFEVNDKLLCEGDSIGGIVEATISGVKAGALGDALFDGLDGKIAYAVFGVPAVKGVEFGAGFRLASMRGSEANDSMFFEDDRVMFESNNMGGIDGGISNGNDIRFRAVIKPASSITIEQSSINLKTRKNEKISTSGRHDSCIVRRAAPCIESAAAIAVLDEFYKQNQGVKC